MNKLIHFPLIALTLSAVMLSAQAFLHSQEGEESNLAKTTEAVTVEDSIQLATDLYLPNGSGPFPCILIRSPYSKNNFGINGEGAIKQFLKRGWVVVVQDTRGKFESNGIYEPFRHERPDGLSTLKWIRSQTWSNGKVAGWGGRCPIRAAPTPPQCKRRQRRRRPTRGRARPQPRHVRSRWP